MYYVDFHNIYKCKIVYSVIPYFTFNKLSQRNDLSKISFLILDSHNNEHHSELLFSNGKRPCFEDILCHVIEEYCKYDTLTLNFSITQLNYRADYFFSLLSDYRDLLDVSDPKILYFYNNKIPNFLNFNFKVGNHCIRFTNYDICLLCNNIKTDLSKFNLFNATTDCNIIMNYFYNYLLFCKNELMICSSSKIPHSIPRLSQEYMLSILKRHNYDNSVLTGKLKEQSQYNHKGKKITTYKNIVRNIDITSDDVINYSYSGGYNTCFLHGKYKCPDDRVIIDIDLSSAYSTSQVARNNPDYTSVKRYCYHEFITSIEELPPYIQEVLSDTKLYTFVHYSFDFDKDVLYPSLPVRDANNPDKGLYYVLSGQGYCTGIELLTTLKLFAGKVHIKLLDLVAISTTDDNIFKIALSDILKKKKLAKQNNNDFTANMMKYILNTLYGKTSQGVSKTKPDVDKVPLCKISSPLYASSATGLTRAVLCTLINIFHNHHSYKIVDCITDGLKVEVPKPHNYDELFNSNSSDIESYLSAEILEEISNNDIIKLFKDAYTATTGNNDNGFLVVKHSGDNINYWRTKCYVLRYGSKLSDNICSGLSISDPNLIDNLFTSDTELELEETHTITIKELLTEVDPITKKYKYNDIYQITVKKRPTIAPDNKRLYLNDTSTPLKTVEDCIYIDTNTTARKKAHKITTIEDIAFSLYSRKDKDTPYNVGTEEIVKRAVARRAGPIAKFVTKLKDVEIGRLLNIKSMSNTKQKTKFKEHIIPRTVNNVNIIHEMLNKLNIVDTDSCNEIIDFLCM